MVSSENAETKFGADQAETNMVKLVDGKLTPMGNTEDDVMDEQLRNRYSSDEERSLQGFEEKTYENSDASLRMGDGVGTNEVPDGSSVIAEDDITASNDSAPNDRVQAGPHSANGEDMKSTATSSFSVRADMVPNTPSTPDPNNPIPTGPDMPDMPVPPMSPNPAPEIGPLPGQPIPSQPEIQEPGEPDRSHQIGFHYGQTNGVTSWPTASVSFTAMVAPTPADQLPITNEDMEPGSAVPGNQYEGMAAGPEDATAGSEDEGMDDQPETGDSSHPYDVKGNKDSSYQPGERPQETAQMMSQPREAMDESGVKAQEMTGQNADRSEVKSTDGLDRKYNDLDAGQDKTAY